MNGVLGLTELLATTPLDEDQRGYVETIQGCGHSLLVIINDILDLSKIEAERLDLEDRALDLYEISREIEALYNGQATQKGLELRLTVDDPNKYRFSGDEVRIRQVLANLVSNAVKFTESGVVEIGLQVASSTSDSSTVLLSVRDTGIGIAPDEHGRIFDSFTQADGSTTRMFGGTGLGLTIAAKLADKMGGSIAVQSEIGVGSTFTVRLELPHVVATGDAGRSDLPLPSGRVRVLLTEDHPVNALVLKRQLDRLGCDVVHAENGRVAVDLCSTDRFDLVFMDIQMPVLDGYEATAQIRQAEVGKARSIIIGLTANAMSEHRTACLEAGMDDYLSKPVRLAELGELISRWTKSPTLQAA
jgi:CheY-like chemotaxis protein